MKHVEKLANSTEIANS